MLKLTQETRFLSSGPPSLSPPPQFVLAYLSTTTRLLWALAPAADSRCSSQDISAAFVSLRVPKMAPLMTNKSQVQSQHISLGHPSYIFFPNLFLSFFFSLFLPWTGERERQHPHQGLGAMIHHLSLLALDHVHMRTQHTQGGFQMWTQNIPMWVSLMEHQLHGVSHFTTVPLSGVPPAPLSLNERQKEREYAHEGRRKRKRDRNPWWGLTIPSQSSVPNL